MKVLSLSLSVVLLGVWALASGCDDDRPVTDAGAGGQDDAEGGSQAKAGQPAAAGGDDALGGAGGQSHLGSGGTDGAPECPADLFEADGQSCSAFGEGFICSDGGTDPCQFGNAIVCRFGVWEHQEAFPAPCGGAGGGGAGGAGGEPANAGAGGQ